MRSNTNPVGPPPGMDGRTAIRDAEPRVPSWRPAVYGWALLALLIGLLLTGFVHYQQQRSRHAEWLAGQRALADRSFTTLKTRLHSSEMLLRAAQSLFLSSESVTPVEFADLYANMRLRSQFPSLQAMSYARRETRADGVHYVISMIAPAQVNAALVGTEISGQPDDLAAVQRSIDTDQPALSAPFRLLFRGTLLSDSDVTLRLPIYSSGSSPMTLAARRGRVLGSVGISFAADKLIGDTLSKDSLQQLQIRISDVTGGRDRLLFDSRPGVAKTAAGFVFARDFVYAGRTWRVRMQSLRAAASQRVGDSALSAGVLASILLALLVFSVANTRQRAIAMAWRMSRRYRESEERSLALNEHQRRLNEKLAHQTSHDALTGLHNRFEFEQRLQQMLETRGEGEPMAMLLYIDLDQFKLVNDAMGHLAGDQLLVQLAACLRRQFGDGDVLARVGGDEFGVLATGVRDADVARGIAERVRRSIDEYVFAWEGNRQRISASIGAVLIGRSGLSMKDLLAHADAACYEVKDLGRNDVHFYSEQDNRATHRREEMKWADKLRRALNEDRLVLVYQEILPLRAASAGTKVELLVRYRDDDGQLVTPGAFMSAAEHYGLMPALDRWVGHTAIANFDRLHPDGAALRMAAINLSGASMEDQRHAGQILDLLRTHGVEPSRVCFEITETVAVRTIERVAAFIEPLRAAGCKIALDDFGAGMSSFAYLKNLQVDIIKIDGNFVRDLLVDPVSQAMVRAVADLGRQLHLEVVAEWVADEATIDILAELGVQYGQGFKLHMPELARFQCD